jgi:hypothetical protein
VSQEKGFYLTVFTHKIVFVLFWVFLLFFYGTGVLTQGLHLEPLYHPFFVIGSSRQGLTNYLPGLASNHDSPDLCLRIS